MHLSHTISGTVFFLLFALFVVSVCGLATNLVRYRRLGAFYSRRSRRARRRAGALLIASYLGALLFGGACFFFALTPVAHDPEPSTEAVGDESQAGGAYYMTVSASSADSESTDRPDEFRGRVAFMPYIPARVSDF